MTRDGLFQQNRPETADREARKRTSTTLTGRVIRRQVQQPQPRSAERQVLPRLR
jgi:hypothetical protein